MIKTEAILGGVSATMMRLMALKSVILSSGILLRSRHSRTGRRDATYIKLLCFYVKQMIVAFPFHAKGRAGSALVNSLIKCDGMGKFAGLAGA